MSPLDALKPSNQLQVYVNIKSKAQFKRKYPTLTTNSKVRTFVKPHTFKKGYTSTWSENVYEVVSVSDDGKQFKINNNYRL